VASLKLEKSIQFLSEESQLHEVVESKSMYKVVNEIERVMSLGKKSIGITSFEKACLQKKFLKSILNVLSLKNISKTQNVFFTEKDELSDQGQLSRRTEFFDYSKVRNMSSFSYIRDNDIKEKDKHAFLAEINSFDSVLWDLPSLKQVKEKSDFYYSVLSHIDAIFLLAPAEGIRKKDMEDIVLFYRMFNIDVYGVVIEKTKAKAKTKKSFWQVLSEF